MFPRRTNLVAARFRAVLLREAPSLRQGSAALVLSVTGNLFAGLLLGAITDTLEELPGLLLLVPAAIALRGNIGGALASRLGSAMHAGTFTLNPRRETLFGQNLRAALVLSLGMSFLLAVVAKGATVAFGVADAISLADYVTVSVVGGIVASVVVVAVTVAVAVASAARGWDLDNVAAPIVTMTGDLATLPSLFAASFLVELDLVTPVVASASAVGAVLSVWWGLRGRGEIMRRVVRQSIPILTLAGIVSLVAGVTVEKRLDALVPFPALLMLLPPFLGSSGALGGIFSSRIASKLHLGVVEPGRFQLLRIAEDLLLVATFAFPVYLLVGLGAEVLAAVSGLASPGVADTVQATLLAGLLATSSVVVVGYLGTVTAFRAGFDPDNYAIPVVTASLDLLGAVSVIIALAAVGVI